MNFNFDEIDIANGLVIFFGVTYIFIQFVLFVLQ